MKNRMTIITAQSAFELDSLENVTRSKLKKMYKRAMFKLHPDRGGDKIATQLLNEAYATLKTIVKPDDAIGCEVDALETQDDSWMYDKNAGHPLHGSGLAATKTREELLKETFDIRDNENTPDVCYWHSKNWHPNQQNGIFFQKGQMAMKLNHWVSERNTMVLWDITNGFLHRKQCGKMRLEVKQYGSGYSENCKMLSNVLREWLEGQGTNENGFHWCDFYSEVRSEIERVFNSGEKSGELFGCNFIIEEEVKWVVCQAKVQVGDNIISISIDDVPSKDQFNPFNLAAVKPLQSIPKRWKISDLVKVLMNGQFHSLKQDFYISDDSALDAALGFRKGYIDNPLAEALSWHGETKRSCQGIYSYSGVNNDTTKVSFGKHSNDSCSFVLDLNNRYPLESLESDVIQLEQCLKLNVA